MANEFLKILLGHNSASKKINAKPTSRISPYRPPRQIRLLQLLIKGINRRQYMIDTRLDQLVKRNKDVIRAGEKELDRLDDTVDLLQKYKVKISLNDADKGYKKKIR